jgi:hypothetical protein
MQVYNYHPETNVLIGSSAADESPLEKGVFLVPAHATEIAPPEQQEGFVLRFVSGAWGYSPVEEPEQPPTEEPVPYVPPEISDRQFFHTLALDGLITEAEALTAVKTGDAPAAFEALIASLPESERFSARMLLEGATVFRRDHPLTNAFGTMYGMTSEQIDDLWRRASML